MAATVWTPARKWMGNLIPMLVWASLTAYGIFIVLKTGLFIGPGLWFLCGATIAGWLVTNLFGLFQNAKMRSELARMLDADKLLPKDAVFVGFCSPKYSGMLDAHEDVGFLCFYREGLTFIGESRIVELDRSAIKSVGFRPNAHSIIGLGRWISIEGTKNGTPLRMMVEPRERPTLLGNLLRSNGLLKRIRAWVAA